MQALIRCCTLICGYTVCSCLFVQIPRVNVVYDTTNFNEPQRQKTYLSTCPPSEHSDQPAHSHSLIRIFTDRILDIQECKVSLCGQRRIWSGCTDAQAELSSLGANVRRVFSHVEGLIRIFYTQASEALTRFFFFFFFFFLQSVASDQSLHCLPIIQQFLDKSVVSKMDLFKFQVKYGKSWYVQIGIYLF